MGADGLRWRLRSQALQLRIAHAQDGSWNKAGAENLTDVLLHANWYGTAAELMAYRADVEKDHVLAADTAALAMCLWDPITAAAATSATHSSKGLASVARAVQSLSARVPEEWHESWRSLPGIQAALDQQAPAGDEAADWHAQLDKWLDHAGLANQNTLLSPAQRRSGGIGAASPTAEKRGTAWAITVPSWPAEPRDGLPNYGWAAPHWKETQMSADVSAVLRRSALFSSLEDEELARVAGIANQRTFAAGASLIAAGDDSALGMWIVLEGEVEVSTDGTILATFGPGEHAGEMALVSKSPRTADVRATTDTTTLQITRWDLRGLMTEYPAIGVGILAAMAERLARTNQALSD